MFNPIIKVETVLSFGPIYGPFSRKHNPEDHLREILGDGTPLIEFLRLESVPVADRIRLFSRVASQAIAELFACDCAERALLREREAGREPDSCSWEAIEIGRRHAKGEETAAELKVAWAKAARAACATETTTSEARAAWEAAWRATWATAARAECATEATAEWAVATAEWAAWMARRAPTLEWSAERQWQLNRALELCEQWDT